MDESLDQYIRNNNVPNLDLSLDEYIHLNKIGKPPARGGNASGRAGNENGSKASGLSKFDRYRHQDKDDDDDDMDEDMPKEMPKLVPVEVKTLPPKSTKPIHQRLGQRTGSICESIHTSQMNVFQPKHFKAKYRRSVQNRLGKAWVNPVIEERNRIALHTLKSIVDNPQNMIQIDGDGLQLLSAFAKAIKSGETEKTIGTIQSADQKYDMAIQKEISMVQGKPLTYTCPGGFVISSDGPGIAGNTKVPTHKTQMSMNQRFA